MIERAYLAAALFTPAQIRVNARIAAIVNAVGMYPFVPSEMSAPIWKGRAPRDCTPAERAMVVQKNKNGMRECRVMIARVSGETKEVDTGVSWEMGYFQCLAEMEEGYIEPDPPLRTLIAYIEPSDRAQSLNLMLAETVHAACYGDAALHECLTALHSAWGVSGALAGSPVPAVQRDTIRLAIEPWHPSKLILHEREPIGYTTPTIVKPRRTALPTVDEVKQRHSK
jgi:hypothetical protein